MGSSSSRNVSSSSSRPQRSTNNLMRRTLSSIVCGGSSSASSSRPPVQIEHHSEALFATSADSCFEITNEGDNIQNGIVALHNETESLSENINLISHDIAAENCLRINEGSKQGKCLSKSKELVTSNEVSLKYDHGESSWEGNSAPGNTSSIQQSLLPIPIGASSNISTACADNSVNLPSMNSLQTGHITTFSHEELRGAQLDAVTGRSNIDTSPFPSVPTVPISSENADDGSHHEAVPASLGVLVSSRERAPDDGSMFHLDVVSISSDILSSSNADVSSNREARRDSRRLFWDAFSRRGSRGHIDSPTLVFSTDDADDLGSRGGRWLLDFNGDFFDDAVGGASSGYLGSRVHRLNERRRQSRSEIWDRLRGGADDSRRSTLCPSGLHPDGTCSCESVLTNEESSTRASITRIVMLAEALFEVLDEIHRQPLSLSLSMVSLPAPESVVDSFPLKNHEKSEMVENDEVKQCYICLDEYEEGDKIRVLPCHHEYHMSCVDKWLKEIHGVCPLCRGDVCNGESGCSMMNTENSSVI